MRAHVADHELAGVAQPLAHFGVTCSRHEAIQVDAVLDDFDLLRCHAPLAQSRTKGIGDHHDAVGLAIKVFLDPGEAAHDGVSLGQRTHRDDRLGPEIADFEDEGKRTRAGDDMPGDRTEKLRAGGNQHVRAVHVKLSPQRGRGGETRVGERSSQSPVVGGRVDPGAHDPDAVKILGDQNAASVFGGDDPGRMVGQPGQHRDLVSGLHPGARQL